jgi:hypothetical protein
LLILRRFIAYQALFSGPCSSCRLSKNLPHRRCLAYQEFC